jgi:tripartite-type tricarboxylate transporter receptor subunit TctC
LLKHLVLCCIVLPAMVAQAQTWPSKPVHVIVNTPAGGLADREARFLGAQLNEVLGQPFVIENRPGGESYIGSETVARAAPDGYTLLFSAGSAIMITPHFVDRKDFNPVDALMPLAPAMTLTLYLTVRSTLPVTNLAEFLAYARANPGKLNYGSAGSGTTPHVAAELLKREARIEANHIPYKGGGPALQDLLGGQIDFFFDPGIGLAQAKAGKTRMLAVTGSRRQTDFPNVPTLAESGFKSIEDDPYFGFYAPKGTPRSIAERLNAAVAQIVQRPETRARLQSNGLEPVQMPPDEFARYVWAEHQRWGKVVSEMGLNR